MSENDQLDSMLCLSFTQIDSFFPRQIPISFLQYTVKQEMLVAIIFGSFENITIWHRFNLEILLEESGWRSYFFHLETTNFGEIY